MAAAKKAVGRILKRTVHEGVVYQTNTLLKLSDADAKVLEESGNLDTEGKAIAYCKSLGIDAIEHKALEE